MLPDTQIPISWNSSILQQNEVSSSECGPIWDPVKARFSSCFLPIISAIPAAIAAVVVLLHCLRLLDAYRPRWTKAFITEAKEEPQELPQDLKIRSRFWTYLLLSLSLVGLALQIVTLFIPSKQLANSYPAIAWAVAAILIIVERPRTAPISILIIYASIFVAQLIVLTHTHSSLHGKDTPLALTLVLALFGVFCVLWMPLRNPALPHDGISPVYDTPTKKLRSPEDHLTPWQYMTVSWMAPMISIGVKRQMHDEDVWDLGWEFKHSRLHEAFRQLRGSVIRRLLQANGIDLVIITVLGFVELFAQLSIPVLLQRLLYAMENIDSPRGAAMTYAFLALAVRLVAAQSSVFKLWYSRRSYERSRGEMITMLYEKTLNRKMLATQQNLKERGQTEENAENGQANGTNGSTMPSRNGWKAAPLTIWGKFRSIFSFKKPAAESKDAEAGASMGKILNLMRNDVYEVAQRFWDFPDFFVRPLGAVLAVVLIWKILGWACLIGALTILTAQILNFILARYIIIWEKKRRKATDDRLQKISQFVEAIRHLRWYGWQEAWLKDILEARQHELHLRLVSVLLNSLVAFTNNFASNLFPVVAFYAFTSLAGLPLRVDIIFPAIDLFHMLENHLRALPELLTTLLNASVAMGRIEEFMKEPEKEHSETPLSANAQPELKNASFAWPGASKDVLEDVTVAFPTGLNVVYGEVAAGKTALLQALLGELDKTAGELIRPDTMVGYCGQTPWLQSMSIRDNILFNSPYEEARYKQALDVCALLPDMASFKHGDLSNIGENGIGLSGGQKARVALARAVYSKARILFLDDPLSALDHQTAESIVRRCIGGPLLEGRTIVLVTHRTELCHGLANQWVEIVSGRATVHEPSAETSNALQKVVSNQSVDEAEVKKREEEEQAAIPEKFVEDEHRAHGGVKLRVYWVYIKAGLLRLWFLSVLIMPAFRVIDTATAWFVKKWGEGYTQPQNYTASELFDNLPPPTENVRPWLNGFLIFAIVLSILYYVTQVLLRVIGYQASKRIFVQAIDRVAHAPFRFYDTTPVGRLMNRLTSDMNTIDGHLTVLFTVVAWQVMGWITAFVVIAGSTPIFLIFGLTLGSVFVYTFRKFLPTSQSLRRLEMVSLSPLMSNFGALVEGLTTVRAFCAQRQFQEGVIEVVDNFQAKDHFYWSLQAWLMYRFDAISASSTLIMTLIAIYTGVSPGLTAFVLIFANKFVNHTHNICKIYGMLEMDFTSVERVIELLDLVPETPGVVSPPASWPTYTGDIAFENVTIRYAPHLDPALSDISFRLPAGSNTAVIGRTGSGKSTLALALLATVTPEEGTIWIDGVDVSTVEKQILRSRITFLAQEPVLFPGSMRKNLDPLSEYTDEECAHVLSKIAGRHNWTLDTAVDAGGRGLSQGQRQLVGLARAMLRRSAVIILDEATASIDFETAQRIQEVLRSEMRESTVITIAHRLEAVKNADYCVVLGKGKLVKAGKAKDMLKEGEEGFGELLA